MSGGAAVLLGARAKLHEKESECRLVSWIAACPHLHLFLTGGDENLECVTLCVCYCLEQMSLPNYLFYGLWAYAGKLES